METEELKVLLVEDNPDDAEFAMGTTDPSSAMEGITWTHATKLSEALSRLAEETFDVILSDLWLPDAEGFETFNRIHESAPHTPVVILTGLLGHDIGPQAVEMGAEDFLLKDDVSIQRVADTLRLAAARHRRSGERASAVRNEPDEARYTVRDYALVRPLRQGALSTVYLARKSGADEKENSYAFKLFLAHRLPEDHVWHFKRAFLHEAELTARFEHPRVVRVVDYGTLPELDLPFSVTEYVHGTPLSELQMDKKTQLTLTQKLMLVNQIAEALQAIHDARLCHRDLKPHNILVTTDLEVLLTDFGTNKSAASEDLSRRTVVGSPLYMSPEAFSTNETDARADIFSLGILSYQLLVGTYPFPGKNMQDMREQIRKGNWRPARKVDHAFPRPLARIIEKMMDNHVNQRYQSVQAVMDDLAATGLL